MLMTFLTVLFAFTCQEYVPLFAVLVTLALFMAVNIARRLNVDPDAALNMVCDKFKRRFQIMEELAQNEGKSISDYTLEELDAFWAAAKKRLNASSAQTTPQ